MKTTLLLTTAVFSGVLALLSAQNDLRSVEQLPIDRFDEYQANTFPPYPWKRIGKISKDLTLSLSPDAESPFAGNKETGKGLLLNDKSGSAGKNAGISCRFTAPPKGEVYLGFDFQYTQGKQGTQGDGLDAVCSLDNGKQGEAIRFHLGKNGKFSLQTPSGSLKELTAMEPGIWYHVAIKFSEGKAEISVLDIRGAFTNPYQVRVRDRKKFFRTTEKIALPDAIRRLSFFSSAPDSATGSWMLDNICMAGKVDADRTAWLPFRPIDRNTLYASKRKVYIYHYPVYTPGWNAQDPGLAWLTRTMLNPTLNLKKDRKGSGTELLYRPYPRPPMNAGLSSETMKAKEMEQEIRLASAMGADGFICDFQSHPKQAGGQLYFTNNSFALMDAAQKHFPNFKIIPAVYSSSGMSGINGESDKGCSPEKYANSEVVQRVLKHPAALRTPDGKVVFSMWLTERHSVEWWKKVMQILEQKGTPIALFAQFNSTGKLKEFSEICYGMTNWGPREPGRYNWTETVRPLTGIAAVPIVMQDIRTRGSHLYESQNTALLRGLWDQAIADKADWTILNTWSDYSEQAMAPSTHIGFAPYDLNAYYTQWFKTGKKPEIIQDRLYYCYRRNHFDVKQNKGVKWRVTRGKAHNDIELVAFLKAPGRLSIRIDGKLYTKDAPAGITSFKVPMPKDKTFVPEFALLRNGKTVLSARGRYTVLGEVEYPHMLYCAGVIAENEVTE